MHVCMLNSSAAASENIHIGRRVGKFGVLLWATSYSASFACMKDVQFSEV